MRVSSKIDAYTYHASICIKYNHVASDRRRALTLVLVDGALSLKLDGRVKTHA